MIKAFEDANREAEKRKFKREKKATKFAEDFKNPYGYDYVLPDPEETFREFCDFLKTKFPSFVSPLDLQGSIKPTIPVTTKKEDEMKNYE